jgi:hypothetical protein
MRTAMLGLVVAAALCAGCGDTSTTAEPSAEGPSDAVPAPTVCRPGDLEASASRVMSVSSQPFVTVTVTNNGDGACTLRGYPRLSASGVDARGHRGDLALKVKRGRIFEREDPGPSTVTVAPGAAAVFHVGTATAYDGGTATIRRLRMELPKQAGSVTVALRLEASAPTGRRIPVGVTALQAASDAQE